MTTPQKKFSEDDYKKNQLAFNSLKKHFHFLYPVLRNEDYQVDVVVYLDERSYRKEKEPVCYIELESKNNWSGTFFPSYFKDVQFLAKKHHLSNNNKPVFWVLFN